MSISSEHYKYLRSNPNDVRQFIRDLYDKMFPSAKDYIKFLREKINIMDKSNIQSPPAKRLENNQEFNHLEELPRDYKVENFCDNSFLFTDHWKSVKKEEIIAYRQLTEQWLKSKTKKQRRIWNYFVLGISKNNIGPKLKEDSSFVISTIDGLQEEFLNLISEKL